MKRNYNMRALWGQLAMLEEQIMKKLVTMAGQLKNRSNALFILAMLAFAGLGLEVVLAFVLEPLLYHAPMQSVPKRNLLCKLRVLSVSAAISFL